MPQEKWVPSVTGEEFESRVGGEDWQRYYLTKLEDNNGCIEANKFKFIDSTLQARNPYREFRPINPINKQEKPMQTKAPVVPEIPYLPKEGQVCEYKFKANYAWSTVEVKYLGPQVAVLKPTNTAECSYRLDLIEFRKIKTEEEVFVEKFRDVRARWEYSVWEMAEELYKVGFRYTGES